MTLSSATFGGVGGTSDRDCCIIINDQSRRCSHSRQSCISWRTEGDGKSFIGFDFSITINDYTDIFGSFTSQEGEGTSAGADIIAITSSCGTVASTVGDGDG